MINAYRLALRFVGLRELPGNVDDPFIMGMLKLDADWPEHDEVPWCSAFVNFVAWMLRLPRSKSLRARSWLGVGIPVRPVDVKIGDVVVLWRGKRDDGRTGHVGFFAGWEDGRRVLVLGGNQGNAVSIKSFPEDQILGYRRLEV